MHLRITNSFLKAFDAYFFTFGSAGAVELTNEYAGPAVEGLRPMIAAMVAWLCPALFRAKIW